MLIDFIETVIGHPYINMMVADALAQIGPHVPPGDISIYVLFHSSSNAGGPFC